MTHTSHMHIGKRNWTKDELEEEKAAHKAAADVLQRRIDASLMLVGITFLSFIAALVAFPGYVCFFGPAASLPIANIPQLFMVLALYRFVSARRELAVQHDILERLHMVRPGEHMS